jgi:integrase/recombinase XerD
MKALHLQELLIRFFNEHLRQQRQVSLHTVLAYRDTFRLLLRFLKRTYHLRPATLELSGLNPDRVLAFLAYLEQQRANSVRSRNARLAPHWRARRARSRLGAFFISVASLDLAVELRVDRLGQAEGRGAIGDFDAVEFEGIKAQLHRQGAQAQVHFVELVA